MTFSSRTPIKALMLPLALIGATVFSGCATTVSPESRMAYDKTQHALKTKPVAIVSDGCLMRIEMGKDDILYQQSDLGSIAMMQTVKEVLDEKGLRVSQTVAPFVCGRVSKEDLTKVDILVTADAKDELNIKYPLLSSTNNFDEATNQVYLDLFKALNKDKLKASLTAEGTPINLELNRSTAKKLQGLLGTDKVFVSLVTGSKPSFGYSMAMGVTTAVASGGTGFLAPQQGQFHGLYLVNLNNSTIEWGKSTAFTGKLFKMPVNERFPYKEMLVPLYDQ